jgi:hypothetical protein
MRALNVLISGPTIQETAVLFAKIFEVRSFQALSGWLDNSINLCFQPTIEFSK